MTFIRMPVEASFELAFSHNAAQTLPHSYNTIPHRYCKG